MSMKNRICIAGCSHYLREYVRNGLYYLSKDFYTRMLYRNYEVYNLSNKNLTSKHALVLVRAFLKNTKFDYCLIQLGEGDLEHKISPSDFRYNMKQLIEMLLDCGVTPILDDTIDKPQMKEYQQVITHLKELYNLKTYSTKKGLLVEA